MLNATMHNNPPVNLAVTKTEIEVSRSSVWTAPAVLGVIYGLFACRPATVPPQQAQIIGRLQRSLRPVSVWGLSLVRCTAYALEATTS
jgi:tetrahydromethanopterin S-methyltransferase subunit C